MARRAPTSSAIVDDVADELYGLPLDQFTSTRNDRAKQVRRGGDSGAASAISRLAKPNTVGWLANQLVRQHGDEINPLLDLGRAMRAATSSLDADQLRQLSKQQHQVVYALVQQARGLADAAGQSVSDSTARGLEDTLHAALADENAAALLISGRLTGGLARSGFPGGALDAGAQPDAAAAPSAATSPRSNQRPDRRDAASRAAQRKRRIAQARADERAAEAAAREARRAKVEAQKALAAAERAVADADADLRRIEAELVDANSSRTDAERSRRQARKVADRAVQSAERASRQLAHASQRRQELV